MTAPLNYLKNGLSRAASGTWSLVSSGVSPIGRAGASVGKNYISPVTRSVYPLSARVAGVAGAIASQVAAEAPQYWKEGKEAIVHVRNGGSMNALGARVSGIADAGKPQQALQDAERNLNTFANRHPLDQKGTLPSPRRPAVNPGAPPVNRQPPRAVLITPAATRAIGPLDQVLIEQRKTDTEEQMQDLSMNLSNFIPIYTMFTLGNIDDPDPQAIINMVRAAAAPGADGVKPSVKELFMRKYGGRLNLIQKAKIWIFNFFGSSSIFSKTVDAYMKKFLEEMRTRLATGRWTEQPENTARLINDLTQFLDWYKDATFDYASATYPRGALKDYRERASEKMFDKSLAQVCKDCSTTLVKHVSPYVTYFEGNGYFPRFARFGNWILNGWVRLVVKHYLPRGLHTVALQTNAATKPHHLPFVKALTDTVTAQLVKLQEQLDLLDHEPPGPPPAPVPGTQHLKDAISRLFYVLEFAHANRPEEILQKKAELAHKLANPGVAGLIDGKIQQGIQDAVLKGTHVLLHHLAVPENTEEMLTNLFFLANAPFKGGEIVTQEMLDESKATLDRVVRAVGSKLGKQAVEEEFQTARPEGIAAIANAAFQTHQGDARTMTQTLEELSLSMTHKIGKLQQAWTPESDILRDLDSMRRVLKAFSDKEQIGADLRGLAEADKSSILLPLIPLYQNISGQSAKLLRLQELQLLHKAHHQLSENWMQIDSLLDAIAEADPQERALEQLPLLQAAIDRIAKYLPENAREVLEIKEKAKAIQAALQRANGEHQKLNYLSALDQQIHEFVTSIEQNRPDRRRDALEKIRPLLKQLTAQDDAQLGALLRAFNDIKLPSQRARYQLASANLKNGIQNIQARIAANRARSIDALPSFPRLREWVAQQAKAYREYQTENGHEIAVAGDELSQDIGQLRVLVEQIRREEQLRLSPRHFGILGAVALGSLSFFYPMAAAAIGGAAYAGLTQLGPLLKGGVYRAKAGGKIAAQAGMGASAAVLVSAIPYVGPPLAAAGAVIAGGAAGQRAIDGVIDGGQDKVNQEITNFFDKAYQLVVLSGSIYQPLAKLVMKQVTDAYTPPA